MKTCPVMNDLARYQADYDHKQAYLDEIARRADDLIDSGDLDAIKEAMSAAELDSFTMNLRTFCRCSLDQSRDQAANEVRQILRSAAGRIAEAQFKKEMDQAAEENAMERHYLLMERCMA